MKFYYTIKPEQEDIIVLKLPCPYVLEDFAISLMQQFVEGQKSVQDLPCGKYRVNLYREAEPFDEKCGPTKWCIKTDNISKVIGNPDNQE